MKIAIVDQDQNDLDFLSNLLAKYDDTKKFIIINKFNDNEEFIEYLYHLYRYDIIYLDNNTSNLITFKTIKELLPNSIIICTTNNHHTISLNNHELLFKPYSLESVSASLNYAISMLDIKPKQFLVYKNDRLYYLNSDEIYYIESNYSQVYFHTKDEEYIAKARSLSFYSELLLNYGYISIHKSIILNVKAVKSATVDNYLLKNGKTLYPSARRKYQAFRHFKQYLEEL